MQSSLASSSSIRLLASSEVSVEACQSSLRGLGLPRPLLLLLRSEHRSLFRPQTEDSKRHRHCLPRSHPRENPQRMKTKKKLGLYNQRARLPYLRLLPLLLFPWTVSRSSSLHGLERKKKTKATLHPSNCGYHLLLLLPNTRGFSEQRKDAERVCCSREDQKKKKKDLRPPPPPSEK